MECSVVGCKLHPVARGYCNRHWKRWRTYGDPLGSAAPRTYSEATKARIAAGVQAAWDTGKFPRQHPEDCGHCLATRGVPKPPRTQAMKDAVSAQRRAAREPSYDSVHHARLPRDRGRASGFLCRCGQPAREWALMEPPSEFLRTDTKGRAYSVRTADYEPMCLSCHKRMDHARRKVA